MSSILNRHIVLYSLLSIFVIFVPNLAFAQNHSHIFDSNFGINGPRNASTNLGVYTMKVFSGKLWVGGHFTEVGASPAIPTNGVATWDGAVWADASQGLPTGAYVGSLESFNGKMYCVAYDGPQQPTKVYRYDSNRWTNITANLPGTLTQDIVEDNYEEFTRPLHVFDDGVNTHLVVAIPTDDCSQNQDGGVYELSGTNWIALATGSIFDGSPQSIVTWDRGNGNRLIIGTNSTEACSLPSDYGTSIWSVEDDWTELLFPLDDGCISTKFNAIPRNVFAMAVYKNEFYAGGSDILAPLGCPEFIEPIYKATSTDLNTWKNVGNAWDSGVSNVRSMGVFQIQNCSWLIVGGSSLLNGVSSNVFQWDGTNWHTIQNGLVAGPILSVQQFGPWMYVGGLIGSVNGQNVNNIVRFRATADWNADGSVNTQDFIAYINEYNAQSNGQCSDHCSADIDGDGDVDTQDFVAFLNEWNACK